MSGRLSVVALITALIVPIGMAGQTPDERVAARELATTRGPAVVMVLATVKTRGVSGGRESQRDIPVQSNATVIESNGLTVMPLSALDTSNLGSRGRAESPTETTDLRIRTADARELPAKVVLRDADLDLVFIRPVDPPGAPMIAADGPTAKPLLMDLVVVLQRTPETWGWGTFVSFAYVQMVIERPRPFYLLPTATLNAGGLGSPVFDARGRFVGVMTFIGGTRASPRPGIVPAEDIRDIAKQAAGR